MREPLTREGIESPESSGVVIADEVLAQAGDLPAGTYRRCALTGAHVGVVVRDAVLDTCDLRNAALTDLRATRLVLRDCMLLGLDVSGADLRDVVCIDCQIRLGRAFGAKLERCWFERCDLRECEFEEAKLENVTFRDCDLRNARLLRSPLASVDFRGSRVEGIAVSPDRLRGAVIAPEQADVFAATLGLRVLPGSK